VNHKDDAVYVEHMLSCINKILEYIGNDKEAFYQSTLVQDAVLRNLQIMAESSQRMSDDLKTLFPMIPWREISGLRNILVHDYLGIDCDAIWSVVEQDLPELKKVLLSM
jgi:uncharacterized protein with HEPN domain